MSWEKCATMSMSQKSRSAVYAGLVELLGEEPVEEMLSHFPVNEAEEAITKADLKVELGVVRMELGETRSELRQEIAETRSELRQEIAETRSELRQEIAELRQEVHQGDASIRLELHQSMGAVRDEIGELRTELHRQHNRLMLFMATVAGIATAIITTAVTLAR
jgi:ClpP class serine protease